MGRSRMDLHSHSKPIEEFNFLDPAVLDNPFEYYRAVQEQAPVYLMPETGMYLVSRYDDLRQVLLDTETFSNNLDGYGMLQGENWKVHQGILQERGWPDLPSRNCATSSSTGSSIGASASSSANFPFRSSARSSRNNSASTASRCPLSRSGVRRSWLRRAV
jgi:hypothetical protein